MSTYPTVAFGDLPANVASNSNVLQFTHGVLNLPVVDAADTLTVAQLLGYDSFRKNVTLSANRALTLPTAAALVAGLSGAKVGTSLTFSVTTGALSGSGDVVVTPGTGGSSLGATAVDTLSQAQFRVRLTNVSSGTEAYQVQRLS
jgi:hypothetical protein